MRSDLKQLGGELFKESGAKRIDLKLNKQGLRDVVKRI